MKISSSFNIFLIFIYSIIQNSFFSYFIVTLFFNNNTNSFGHEMILNLVCLKYFDSALFNFIRKEIKYF